MSPRIPRRPLLLLAVGAFMVFWSPAIVVAHSELESSTPADGATVESPFDDPIVLRFSAALADGSKADLLGPDGAVVASATVNGPEARMAIKVDAALVAGDYQVKWVSIAEDGDLLRGTISFAVAPALPTATPTASPSQTASPTEAPTEAPTTGPATSAPASPPPSATPTPSPAESPASGGGDVILPIAAALLVIAVGAVYLLGRRNRPTLP